MVNLQLGDNSVNSVPKPNSISKKLYSQVDDVVDDSELKRELTLLTYDEAKDECVADEIVDRVVKVVAVEEELKNNDGGVVLLQLLLELTADADALVVNVCAVVENILLTVTAEEEPPIDLCSSSKLDVIVVLPQEVNSTGTAVAGFDGGNIENRSLFVNGSKDDCEDKLNTELQFIDLMESSSLP